MTILELKKVLDENNIPRNLYNLEMSGLKDQRICVEKTENGWNVYYSERGQKFDLKRYFSEHDACMDLLQRLLALKK